MFHHNIAKVPGQVPKNVKENPGHIEDLEKLSVPCLTEILERQNKLLSDRVFIKKLPDRGERISKLKERLEEELKKRDEVSNMCNVMSTLTINGKDLANNLEWMTKNGNNLSTVKDKSTNENDETVLEILATHGGAGFHSKIIKKEDEPEPLIKPSDLADEKDDEKDIQEYEPFVEMLSSKIDATSPKGRFIPFKCLNKERELINPKVRDITSASPPISKLSNVKLVSLQESLKLQAEQARHLRLVQMKHASERLREKGSVTIGDTLPAETTAHYRESPPSDSEEEILDEDAKEEAGGVTFPITNS